jgi:hypothetical protein
MTRRRRLIGGAFSLYFSFTHTYIVSGGGQKKIKVWLASREKKKNIVHMEIKQAT